MPSVDYNKPILGHRKVIGNLQLFRCWANSKCCINPVLSGAEQIPSHPLIDQPHVIGRLLQTKCGPPQGDWRHADLQILGQFKFMGDSYYERNCAGSMLSALPL